MATFNGTSGNDFYAGTSGADSIYGNGGSDDLSGGAGADYIDGGTGDDWLFSYIGLATDNSVDTLIGGDGADHIFIGYGDSANGGNGFDNLFLDLSNAAVSVSVDFTGLWAGGSGTLGGGTIQGFEQLDTVIGTAFDDVVISGSPSSRILSIIGGAGSDLLIGGAGHETIIAGTSRSESELYYDELYGWGGDDDLSFGIGDSVDGGSGFDRITFNLGASLTGVSINFATLFSAGADTIQGTYITGIEDIDWIYGTSFNDVINAATATTSASLSGGDGNDTLLTGSGADRLEGGSGSDSLNGGAGADVMIGGLGDDIYTVDNIGDVITESAGEGIDTVYSSLTRALWANVENLTLTGASAIDGTGNSLANILIGNSAANSLSGGDGADSLFGEDGNDTLTGGNGDDVLNGGTGMDSMTGGSGADSYIIDNAGDTVFEANSGYVDSDTVTAYVSWTLAAGQEIERLRAGPGTDPINLTGNEFAQKIQGNDGANILIAGGGNDVMIAAGGDDTLYGGLGLDKMTGGLGADIFVIEAASGMDMITDFVTGTDKIDLTALGMDWQDVLDAMTEASGTTTLDLGGGNSLIISDVANDSLQVGDFILTSSFGLSGEARGGLSFLEGRMWSGGAANIVFDTPEDALFQFQPNVAQMSLDWHLM